MIQFLQEEIECLKPYRHKVLHEETVRNDLSVHQQHLQAIVSMTKEAVALDELQVDEEQDQLLLEKLERARELQERQKQLQMAVLEKGRLMRECQLNELKLQTNREYCSQIQAKCKTNNAEKQRLMREIRQNEVICERARLQNEDLRRKCEQQITTVTSETVNKESVRSETIIRHRLEENISIIGKMISLTEPYHQNCLKLCKSDKQADSLRVIQLTRQLQYQNAENFMLKGQLKCEQTKYFEISSKYELLSKSSQVRQALSSAFDKQEEELCMQISKERAKREQLQSKLSQYKRLRKQLQEMYGKLSTHYDSCKYSDLHCIKQMNKNSHRMERNITQQRHFLIERYSIVDNYRKYLRNN